MLQVINALHDKGSGHTRLVGFFMHNYCKQIMNIELVYKQKSHLLLESRHSCTCINFLCNVTDMSSFLIIWIIRVHHLGNFTC